MAKKMGYYIGIMLLLFAAANLFAQTQNGMGQSIQINTRLHSFTGKPSWLIMIRDIDHNENIPYVYDFTRNDNFWMAFTQGRNYLIVASTLQFAPYRANPYRTKVINDFCHLESHGRVARGESVSITIEGDLSPNTDGYTCNVTRFSDNGMTVPSSD